MLIAVDPNIIPLGSKVLILFEEETHKQYNGIYTARDTGGAIKGHIIDLFLGDLDSTYVCSQITRNFGRTKAKVIIL